MSPVPVPSVEERLHATLTALDALRVIANLIDESSWVFVPLPQCSNPDTNNRAFAEWTGLMATSLREQVSAVKAALPATAANLRAPLTQDEGGAR